MPAPLSVDRVSLFLRLLVSHSSDNRRGYRERDSEFRTGLFVNHIDFAVHRLAELVDDGQANACAYRFSRELGLRTVEQPEDLFHLLLRHTGTEVSDGNNDRILLAEFAADSPAPPSLA